MIDFDVETTGLQYYAADHYAFLFQFFDGEKSAVLPYSPDNQKNREEIQRWLNRGAEEGIRAWNAKFDWHFGGDAGFVMPPDGKWHDAMIVAHAINERRPLKLKSVAKELFGEDADDLQKQVQSWLTEERKRRKQAAQEAGEELIEPNYSDVPMSIMEPYALEDVLLTRRVSEQYDPIIESSDLKTIVEFEREVLDALYAIETRGFPVDAEAYKFLELELIENLERMEEQIALLADDPDFNPNSSQQLYEKLKERGADLSLVTNNSMDRENLETVDDELAQLILDFRTEYKLLSTYVRPAIGRKYDSGLRVWKAPFIAPDGRVHCNYRQVGTRTGRSSASEPNLQNQPRDDLRIRYCFQAEPGYKLVTCDLSSLEMRVFAAYTGEGRLLNALREGQDVYELAAHDLGIRDRVRAGGTVETGRQRAKQFNLSIIYGGGVRTIRKQMRCNQAQAREYLNRYYSTYPEVDTLQNSIAWKLQDRGYIKSAWGRHLRCDNPDREAYKFVNYLVQGTSADLFKQSLINLHKDGVPVVAQIHDEVIAHVPEEDAEEARELIIKRLTDHSDRIPNVPLTAEGAIVDRWSEAKNPDFKPKFAK